MSVFRYLVRAVARGCTSERSVWYTRVGASHADVTADALADKCTITPGIGKFIFTVLIYGAHKAFAEAA